MDNENKAPENTAVETNNKKPEPKPTDGKTLAIFSIILAIISLLLSVLSSFLTAWSTNEYMKVFVALILIGPILMAVACYVVAIILEVIGHSKMKALITKDPKSVDSGRKTLDIVAIVFLVVHPLITLLINLLK